MHLGFFVICLIFEFNINRVWRLEVLSHRCASLFKLKCLISVTLTVCRTTASKYIEEDISRKRHVNLSLTMRKNSARFIYFDEPPIRVVNIF